ELQPGGLAIQIFPLIPLEYATKYTLTLNENIIDVSGFTLTDEFEWSFVTIAPVIDQAWVLDSRCNIGKDVSVALHLSWNNGTNISYGKVFVDNETVTVDSFGWANCTIRDVKLGNNILNITGVDINGIKKFLQLVDSPSIIGDRINLSIVIEKNRINVDDQPKIVWTGKYEYDDTTFVGEVIFEEFSTSSVQEFTISVKNIVDEKYNLTSYLSNDFSVIVDRLKVLETGVSATKNKLGEPLTFWCKVVYDYDEIVFDGSKGIVYANGEPMNWSDQNLVWEKSYVLNEPGSLSIKVTGIEDNLYNLTRINDLAGSKTASWEISFWETYWPILLILGGFSSVIILLIINVLRKKGKKEEDFCKEHPEVVEAENKACWDAQVELDTAVGNVRDAFDEAMPRWKENLRTVGKLLIEWDLKVALISHWTGAEKEIYETAEKVQKVAGIVTSAAGKAKTVFKEGGEAALKELGKDVAKDVSGNILGEISSTLGQVLELEDWAIREIGVGIAQGLTGINPRQKASNIRKSSEIICTDLMSWIDHSYAWNSGRRPPDTLKSCIEEMQNMLNDLNKALEDFENAVKDFRCVTCKIPPHISEEIQEIQQKIEQTMKSYGDLIDKVEQRLNQARKIYKRKDVYPKSGHEWLAKSGRWTEQIDKVLNK
ncbi:hypothetical protein JW865_06645, partial [Candidatus Bathyarchaeota archaeon]|nr:hypothetical protein [Candidatus Bathyarchaeota archaeon]